MGNTVTYQGKLLATFYLEKKGEIEGYTFEFNGLAGLEKLLHAPGGDKLDEGDQITEIKQMLVSDKCFGIYLSTKQRVLSRCKN